MTEEKICRNCKQWDRSVLGMKRFGYCARWRYAYLWNENDIADNEVIIEDRDDVFAAVGPDFGCVLFEEKDEPKEAAE